MANFDRDAVQRGLCNELATKFGDPDLVDLQVQVEDITIDCHKLVLCLQSPWFKKALTGRFKEANADIIRFEEDSPEAVRALIEFCYRLDYTCTHTQGPEATALFHIEVFATAEKYLVEPLQSLAASYLAKTVEVGTPGSLQSVTAIRLAYTITSDPKDILRSILIKHTLKQPEILRDRATHASFHATLDSTPLFAADIARALVAPRISTPVEHVYWCPTGCGSTFVATMADNDTYSRVCEVCRLTIKKRGSGWKQYIVQ